MTEFEDPTSKYGKRFPVTWADLGYLKRVEDAYDKLRVPRGSPQTQFPLAMNSQVCCSVLSNQ
jgi:hypothetical protein